MQYGILYRKKIFWTQVKHENLDIVAKMAVASFLNHECSQL